MKSQNKNNPRQKIILAKNYSYINIYAYGNKMNTKQNQGVTLMQKTLFKSLAVLSTLFLVGCNKLDTSSIADSTTTSDTTTLTEDSSTTVSTAEEENLPDFTTYKLTFVNKLEKGLKGLTVRLTGEGFDEILTTGIRGSVTFEDLPTADYQLSVSNLPAGYHWDSPLAFDKAKANQTFVAEAELREFTEYTTSTRYKVGDILCDFYANRAWKENNLTKSESTALSEIMEDKDAVILNFWGTWCGWCVREMPYFEQFFQAHDNIGIYAVSDADDIDAVASFKQEYSLSFDLASLPNTDIITSFGINSYPTTVIVDASGLITKIHSGALLSLTEVETLLADYLD